MGFKGKICVFFFLFLAVFLVCVFGRSDRDPEIGVCKLKCEEQDDVLRCKQRCEKYHQEKQKREREGGQGGQGGEYDIVFAEEEQDLRKIVEECHQSCQGSQGEQERPRCFQSCMQKQLQEQGKRRGGGGGSDIILKEKSKKSGDKKQESKNPYVFQDKHFTTRLETEHGKIRVLQKFSDRSDLFEGIEKYRFVFLEAEPQTFITPSHWDADSLFYVANGEGTISLINSDSRQSHNIKRGDIFRLPAGINAYLINKHNDEKLVLAKILRSVSVPGELQPFFSFGGGNRESSFYNAFSTEVLEAAFNVDRATVEKLFGGQQQKEEQGIFKKATEEQIRSMSGKDESRTWPFGEKTGPYNIYKKNPSVANNHGTLFEADYDDYSELRAVSVGVSVFNITQGSMAGPFYNTKTTTVLVVPDGEGRFEMACPHLSEQSTGDSGQFNPGYERVSSDLKRGTVVVVPAGHPIVIEASGNRNLEVIGFGLKSDKIEWFPLAGKGNVMSQWEDEAVELTVGAPATEVKKVIQKQNDKLFFKGPVRRGREFA